MGGAQAESGHDVVVGCPLVARKLRTAVGKVVQTQRAVESQLINAMLTIDLSVVTGRGNSDALV